MNAKTVNRLIVRCALVGTLGGMCAPALLAASVLSTNQRPVQQLVVQSALELLHAQAAGGDAHAQFELATMYLEGEGVRQDVIKAMALYEQSARLGYADAQFTLGLMFASGDGVPFSPHKALAWLEKAANQGHKDASFLLTTMQNSDLDIGC